jgi:hypothetical protein
MGLGRTSTIRVESRDLIEVDDREIVMLEGDIHRLLRHHRGYQAVQAINGGMGLTWNITLADCRALVERIVALEFELESVRQPGASAPITSSDTGRN